ncbi:MAG: AI-2E family transporter [Pirellulaceae bacterium]|nr:AI-2E family transporter [Pirellulaceae bacterium]
MSSNVFNNATPKVWEPTKKRGFIAICILSITAIFVFVQSFSLIAPIVLSLLLTLIISLAVNPVVYWLRARIGGRSVATGVIVASLTAVLALTVWALVGPIKSSVTDLAESLPAYWERFQKPLIKLEQQAVQSEEKLQAEVNSEIKELDPSKNESGDKTAEKKATETKQASGSIRSNVGQMLRGAMGSVAKMAFNGTQVLLVLVTVFFGVIFTLLDPRPIFGAIFLLVPESHHDKASIILERVGRFAPAWAGSMLMGMATIGVLVFLLMWPIFGMADALVLGLIAGVFESVPFLGPVLSTVPALLLALGEGGYTPVWVLLAFIMVQALENNVILPLIMARGMKLHTVAIIFSMLLCVTCFGALGVLVAAPMVAIVSIVYEELYRKQFLPTTSDNDIDRLARITLGESRRFESPPSRLRE